MEDSCNPRVLPVLRHQAPLGGKGPDLVRGGDTRQPLEERLFRVREGYLVAGAPSPEVQLAVNDRDIRMPGPHKSRHVTGTVTHTLRRLGVGSYMVGA